MIQWNWLAEIKKEPGQYFVLNPITRKMLKQKLIRCDSGGYLRITEVGENHLKQKSS